MAGDDSMKRCDVVPFSGQPGVCRRCGSALTGRRTAWCSDECEREWQRNHYWQMARPATVTRDGHCCVKCGSTGTTRRHARRVSVRNTAEMRRLGLTLEGDPRSAIVGRSAYVYVYTTHRIWLEVNHIEPRVGQGYNAGCHHHLTNLETLCHPCHVIETTRQGRERRLFKELAQLG